MRGDGLRYIHMARKTVKDRVDKLTLGNAYLNQDNSEKAEDITERKRQSGYSSYYHKYFEGYVEHQVTDAKGKVRIERIYAGDTYRHKLTDKQWVLLKLLYVFLFIAACAVYVFTISRPFARRTEWYIRLPQALGTLILFVLLYTVVNYIIAKRDLTKWGFKESSNDLKLRTLFAAVGVVLPVPFQIVYVLINHAAENIWYELLLIPGCLLSAAILMAMWYIEAKIVKYDTIPYTKDVPSDAISIW